MRTGIKPVFDGINHVDKYSWGVGKRGGRWRFEMVAEGVRSVGDSDVKTVPFECCFDKAVQVVTHIGCAEVYDVVVCAR